MADEQALTRLLWAAREVFGPDNVGPDMDDPGVFYAVADDGTGVYFTTRHPATPPAPASQEGDRQPEGWRERLAALLERLEVRCAQRPGANRPRWFLADLRVALAAASQGGGGLAEDARRDLAVKVLDALWAENGTADPADETAADDEYERWHSTALAAAAAPPAETGGGGRDRTIISEDEAGGQWYADGNLTDDEARQALLAYLLTEDELPSPDAWAVAAGVQITRAWWRYKHPGSDDMEQCDPGEGSYIATLADLPVGPGGGLDREALEAFLDGWLAEDGAQPCPHEPASGWVKRECPTCTAAALAPLLTGGGRDG